MIQSASVSFHGSLNLVMGSILQVDRVIPKELRRRPDSERLALPCLHDRVLFVFETRYEVVSSQYLDKITERSDFKMLSEADLGFFKCIRYQATSGLQNSANYTLLQKADILLLIAPTTLSTSKANVYPTDSHTSKLLVVFRLLFEGHTLRTVLLYCPIPQTIFCTDLQSYFHTISDNVVACDVQVIDITIQLKHPGE